MQLKTLLKAGTWALDIVNHQSAQSLGKLVQNGVKRRVASSNAPQPSAPAHHGGMNPAHHPHPSRPAYRQAPHTPALMQAPLPTEQMKKALQYVTPENIQKAMQWQEIVRSFLTKK